MSISQSLLNAVPDLNPEQKAIVGHINGPMLVIAGPGSGKTHTLVLRTMNLLMQEKALPKEIVLCTFTEKAAFELRDRLSAVARKVGFADDLSELRASTIHGFCHKIIAQHRHLTPLGSNFDTLDDLTQLLFIYDHFDKIIGSPVEDLYFGRWKTKWGAIEGARDYFNKMTEELIDPAGLGSGEDGFLKCLSRSYLNYRRLLFENNQVDFAHLQSIAYALLNNQDASQSITGKVKYVMVDEYQDTNYIQEQILLKLAGKKGNLCVVGDEDQSLYRFRGATVRNILEFPRNVKECTVVTLTTNYRSHRKIIDAYDRWMASADWSNPHGSPFRYPKTIHPDPDGEHPEYPAIFCVWGKNKRDEAERFADLVHYLGKSDIISDYCQVALLLHSVRQEHSDPYQEALQNKGIPVFCPRARGYFENDEVRLMVGCFAIIFGYHGEGRGEIHGAALQALAAYVDLCLVDLGRSYGAPHPLAEILKSLVSDVAGLQDGEALDTRPADFFCGSGTTLAVAEKLGRRWIGCDLGRWGIHVSRKRLLGIEKCKPFEILNLGKYERQYWQGVTFGGKGKGATEQALYEYLAFMLKLYGAQPVSGLVHLHGKKGKAMVHIGAVDAPVTIDEINLAISECMKVKQSELHVLGWEWEMGLNDLMVGEAKKQGIKLLLLQIPREVMEQQAVDKGDIQFFELAYLEVEIKKGKNRSVTIHLKDFVIPNTELIPEEVRSKVKKWSDYIDYWAVDWDFRNDTFMQGWVAYRTRKERKLPLTSDQHAYEKPGKYRILVKVIDIFGNDTSQAFDVEVS